MTTRFANRVAFAVLVAGWLVLAIVLLAGPGADPTTCEMAPPVAPSTTAFWSNPFHATEVTK